MAAAASARVAPVNTNECSICLEYRKARKRIELPCGHIYCRMCLKQLAQAMVTGENPSSEFVCPVPECARPFDPSEVVAKTKLKKLHKRENQRHTSSQEGNMLCPQPRCQGVVNMNIYEPECNVCHRKICKQCEEIVRGRHECNPDILRNVRFIRDIVINCPFCRTPIIKSDGCNNMRCRHCRKYFDYNTGVRSESDYELLVRATRILEMNGGGGRRPRVAHVPRPYVPPASLRFVHYAREDLERLGFNAEEQPQAQTCACGRMCELATGRCCHCADQRAHKVRQRYVDGQGLIVSNDFWIDYCRLCSQV
jgi:hypothetical protein